MLSAGLPCFPRHRIPMFTSSSLLCLLAVFFMMVPAILGLTNNTLDLYSPNGRCMPRAEVLKYLPQCDGYTDWPYMYFNLDFAAELQAYGQALLESTTTLDHCLFWNMRLYCSAYAPPCFLAVPPANNSSSNGQVVLYNGTNIPVAVPVAQPTCSYICEQRYTNCTPTMIEWGLEEYIDQWFRCERPYDTTDWGVPSQEIFVPNTSTVLVDMDGMATPPFEVELTCNNASQYLIDMSIVRELACPEGLHSEEQGVCTFDCPEPLVTEDQYHSLETAVSVMGWLSFILMLFLMICYLLRPTRRFVPELFFLLSVAGLSFAFCLGSMIGHEDVWCSSDHENNSVGDPACTVQGISYVFFTLASACWWCLISFNIFLWAITGKNPDASPKKNGLIIAKDSDDGFDCHNIPRFWFYRAFYHALCWLFPLIIVIVLLASERLGFGGSDLYCTAHSNQHVTFTRGRTSINAHGAEEFDTWKLVIIVPILIMALMTACFTLVTFGIIAVRLAKMGTAYRTNKGFAKLLKQWRLLAFVILFFFIYLFVLIYEIEFSAIKNKQYKAYEDYFGCLALLEITSVNDTCELSREVSYGLWMFKTIIVCGQGVWVFFILGSVKDNYNRPLRLVRKFLLLVGLEHFCPTFASSLSEKSTSGSSADSSQRPSSSRRNKKHLPNVGGANVADLVENEKKIAFGMTMVEDTSSDSSSSSSYNSSDESSGYEDARPKRVRKSQQQQQAVSGDRNTQEEEEETGN